MAVVEHTIQRPRTAVFEALVTPTTYPHWLVGCKDIRSVDADWPAVGSAFHHRVGLGGPVTVADLSKVLEIDDGRLLAMEVRARPIGRGRVIFTLTDGPATGSTVLRLDEVPIGLLAPTEPVVAPLTKHRNTITLQNLARYLEQGEEQDRL